jgi:preprotein translocase subunit YajC
MIVSRAGVESGGAVLRTRRAMVLSSTSKKNLQLKLALSAPVLALAPCVLFYASTAAADDSWQNLKHITHERYYTVVDRKSNCITGHIVKTNDHELTLKLSNRTYATFDRANVLRVSVSQAAPYFPPRVQADVGRVYDVIYNDKSSWSDLKSLAGQEVKVVKTGGETYEGQLLITSETQIELDRTGGKLELAKEEIAQVYHLRPKPLTDSEKYSAQKTSGLTHGCGPTTSISFRDCLCACTTRRYRMTIRSFDAKTIQERMQYRIHYLRPASWGMYRQ